MLGHPARWLFFWIRGEGNTLMRRFFLMLAVATGVSGSGLNAQESSEKAAGESGDQANSSHGDGSRESDASGRSGRGREGDQGSSRCVRQGLQRRQLRCRRRHVYRHGGRRRRGRRTNRGTGRAIHDRYTASFADNPGSTIAIQVQSLRFLGPETALEEGRATITSAEGAGPPEIIRFITVYVK